MFNFIRNIFNFIRNIYYLTRMYYYNPRTNGIAWIDLFFSIAYRVVSIGIIYFIYIHFGLILLKVLIMLQNVLLPFLKEIIRKKIYNKFILFLINLKLLLVLKFIVIF